MAATFASIADAEKYLADLMPGWQAGKPYSADWIELLTREQVVAPRTQDQWSDSEAPNELLAIGRSVIALGYGLDDLFAPLRALAWKSGAWVTRGGIHVHEQPTLLAAIRCHNADDARARADQGTSDAIAARVWQHGEMLIVAIGVGELLDAKARLIALAGDRPLAVEMLSESFDDAEMIAVKKRIGNSPPRRGRLVASYWGNQSRDRARDFARSLGDQPLTIAGSTVLIDPVERPKRLAVLAYRRGANVTVTDELDVTVSAYLWFETVTRKGRKAKAKTILAEAVRSALDGLMSATEIDLSEDPDMGHCTVRVRTTDPGAVMTRLANHASSIDCEIHLSVSEVDPIASAVRRLLADVTHS